MDPKFGIRIVKVQKWSHPKSNERISKLRQVIYGRSVSTVVGVHPFTCNIREASNFVENKSLR